MLTVVFIVLVSFCFVIGCIQLYGFFNFRSLRQLIIIRKRYPTLVIWECIACILYLSISVPLRCEAYLNDTKDQLHDDTALVYEMTPRILNMILSFFIADCEACRMYLIAYDLQYLRASSNHKWKVVIDRHCAEKDWYLRSRGKWGNKFFVFQLVFAYYMTSLSLAIFTFIFTQLLYPDHVYIAMFTDLIFFMIPGGFVLYSFSKTPNANDNMYFYIEFRTTVAVLLSGFFVYCSAAVLSGFDHPLAGMIMTQCGGIFSITVPSALSTIWIPSKINASAMWGTRDEALMAQISISNSNSTSPKSPSSRKDEHRPTRTSKLRSTLQDEATLEQFINWMYREFSSETILAVIEFSQFKTYLIKYGEGTGIALPQKMVEIKFAASVPRSSIIVDEQIVDQPRATERAESVSASGAQDTDSEAYHIRRIASALYSKYIEPHCELELNTSWTLRMRWELLNSANYPEEDLPKLFALVEDVLREMMKYMSQSFLRFDVDRDNKM